MRSLSLLLTVGLLASCSVGNDFSRTTFQKKRYSRGYYVHHAKDRNVPNGNCDAAATASEGQDQETRSTTKAAPPEMVVNSGPEPIQAARRDRIQPLPLSLSIPARKLAGMKYEERTLMLPESTETPEKEGRKSVHWTTIANLVTLIGGMLGSLFNSPLVLLGLAAPFFAAISFAFAGPKRRHSGLGAAILTFLLFFITLIVVENRPDALTGMATILAALILLVCWLAYALVNRSVAPYPMEDQDAFHGVDMEPPPEPKRPLHWSTWVASGMMLLGVGGSLAMLFLAWIPAFIGLQTSGPNTAHSGSGLALGLFIASLLSLLVYFALVLALFTFLLGG